MKKPGPILFIKHHIKHWLLAICIIITTAFSFQNCSEGFKIKPVSYDHTTASLAASRCEVGSVRICTLGVGTSGTQSCHADELSGGQWGSCLFDACVENFYRSGDTCLPKVCDPQSQQACNVLGGIGTQNCNTEGSELSGCQASQCDPGYFLDGVHCTPMQCTPGASMSCDLSDGIGVKTCNLDGRTYSLCLKTPTICSPGTTTSCEVSNGVGQTSCSSDGLMWSTCQITICNTGYEYDLATSSCNAISSDQVTAINPSYPIDQIFYRKQILVNGLPIVGSANVSDQAFIKAKQILNGMMSGQPSLWPSLTNPSAGFNRVVIIAKNEKTTDIPEYRYLRNDPDTDWDARARGFGGQWGNPITSAGEENILCLPEDRYYYANESILIHEFAHTIMNVGLRTWNPSYQVRITDSYNQARLLKLWNNTYANTNFNEYFAEVAQSWFDSNGNYGATRLGDGVHNDVWYRTLLKNYDVGASTILNEVFTDTSYRWTPRCR